MKEKYVRLTTPEEDNALLTDQERLSFLYMNLDTELALEEIETIDKL